MPVRRVNFTPKELECFLDAVEEVLPLLATHWESVTAMHAAWYPSTGCNTGFLKSKIEVAIHNRGGNFDESAW